MPSYELDVNGRRRTVEVAADTPLLWVLRDSLELTGTKYGCGRGVCGSCTVHIDGEARRSCITLVSEVRGQRITTIEGLAATAGGRGQHPLQRAWIAEQVPQCGYCQSDQLMQAAALLRQTPHPTDAQIDAAMSDLLCRCGTYLRIRRAIQRAAQEGGRQ